MEILIILIMLAVLGVIYALLYKIGMKILRSNNKAHMKKWGNSFTHYYEEKETDFKLYLTAYFIVLAIILTVFVLAK